MVLVIGGASDEEAEASASATLSIDDLAVLAIDRALEDGVRIKDAIAQVVAEHPLPDGSLREPQAGVYENRSGNEILTYAAGEPSSRMVRARLTPGPPACATYSKYGVRAGIGDQPAPQFRLMLGDEPEHFRRGRGIARQQQGL